MTEDAAVGATRSGVVARTNVDAEQRRRMIAEAAYFRAEHRGFVQGDPLEDWLAAEAQVDDMLRSRAPGKAQAASRSSPEEDQAEPPELQHGEPKSIARSERLKRMLRQHPGREIPRVDEPGAEESETPAPDTEAWASPKDSD